MNNIYDVIILGAGPAGLAAGLYAGRSCLKTLIIEKGQDGGQIAIVTSAGVVPHGNPDRIESSNATRFGYYSIEGMDRLSKDDFFTVHGGYDRQFVLEDPNLAVPLDALRNLEKAGEFGELVNYFATTTGTGTATGSAAKFGDAIGKRLLEENVQAVILTST